MQKRILVLGGTRYVIPDLGPELNKQIIRFYDSFTERSVFDLTRFHAAVKQYFDLHITNFTAHDDYFNVFAPLWDHYQKNRHSAAAESIWKMALEPVLDWEADNKRRTHKGTPYYFWAVTVLLARDVDRGFILMHRALNEDLQSSGQNTPSTPGIAFVTLDYKKKEQYFGNRVVEIATLLERYIAAYRNTRNRSLTLDILRNKFLSDLKLRPAAFFFVYLMHKLRAFQENIDEGLIQSDFSGLLELDLLFGLCLVTDSVVKNKYHVRKAQFIELAAFLSQRAGFRLGDNELGRINGEFNRDFGNAATKLLQGSICGLILQPSESDIALCYGLRNRGAHNIEGHQVIYDNFDDIIQGLLSALFLSVEVLY